MMVLGFGTVSCKCKSNAVPGVNTDSLWNTFYV